MNTPVLTSYGVFKFKRISIEETRELLKDGFISAVGHQGTAELLSKLLGIEIPHNRVMVKMKTGDKAVVFRVLQRLPEGTVLNEEEIKKVPFELGLLEKVE